MDEINIPTKQQVDDLFNAVVNSRGPLNEFQKAKLRESCYQVYLDNPDNGFRDHVKAAKIYLKFIVKAHLGSL